MKILFVNCKFKLFDGIYCGAANRNSMFIKGLTQFGQVDVISFRGDDGKSDIENCNLVFSKDIKTIPVKSNKIISFLKKWTGLLFHPYSVDNFYRVNKERKKIVEHYLKSNQYDFIACRYVDDAIKCGLIEYHNKLIIDVDDNPVTALRRDLTTYIFRHVWGKWEMQIRLAVLGKVIENILRTVRCSFYSNILEPPFSGAVFLHNTTTLKESIPDITEDTPMRMLIVGYIDYFPNKLGIQHFVENVFPLIRKKIPGAELHIVGKSADKFFLDMLNSIDGVSALGFVDDITEEYKSSRVILVPIYVGSGTSVKFVEGLQMNRPIVSTPMGVRGFEHICYDGIHYMLANDDNDFANKVLELFTSLEKSIMMSHQAYKVCVEHFSQKKFMEIMKEAIVNSDINNS